MPGGPITVHRLLFALVWLALTLVPGLAAAQDPVVETRPDGTTIVRPATDDPLIGQVAPDPAEADRVSLTFGPDTSLYDLILFFAPIQKTNFVLTDVKKLKREKVTIISNREVAGAAAWEAFLSALEVAGYTLSYTGETAKVIRSKSAGQRPIRVGKAGEPVRGVDEMVTQLVQLDNTRVDDLSKVLKTMAPSDAKLIAYAPTNTLIITDTAANIRKLVEVTNELDVAAPQSTLRFFQLVHAEASDVKALIDELYGPEDEAKPEPRSARARRRARRRARARARRRARQRRKRGEADPVSAGEPSRFVSKVIEDERTNSLIVLANPEGHEAIADLIASVDVSVDVSAGARIRVIYLENAKAEDVASVLSELSEGGEDPGQTAAARRAAQRNRQRRRRGKAVPEPVEDERRGAMAVFDGDLRIAADENTNALVMIADNDEYRVLRKVIDALDVERRSVFVDAVVVELSSEDAESLGLAYHAPVSFGDDEDAPVGFAGSQLGSNSLGLSQDALSGLAFGVFGEGVEVPTVNPSDGTAGTLTVPAFGIALNALTTFGSTQIVSNPNLTTLDNEEAEIVVGRKVPFPTSSGLNSLGSPVVSFQREDVAISLSITPRVNSEDHVTLELELEVQEVEESAQSQAVAAQGGGFVTSQRRLQTVALVRDNQTMVVGGLVASIEGERTNKVPILGDLPIVGGLFRSRERTDRKTNLMIFLTPHIVDEPEDMLEIQQIKEAQRRVFLDRFYGRSQDQVYEELRDLLRFSMNLVDEPTIYRGNVDLSQDVELESGRGTVRTAD